jgi:pyridinium-3,5-biscarboxylic acid mononucleotide synthase
VNADSLKDILGRYKAGDLSLPAALDELRDFPVKDLGYASLDSQREVRLGFPEVIYGAGKSDDQLRGIVSHLVGKGSDILATKATERQFAAVADLHPGLRFDPVSRTISLKLSERPVSASYIAVVTAGTSDVPVAEEAAVTAELFGNRVERIYDVGVAGLHRLIGKLSSIRGARVVVAVAGMEGALPSVLGGLVDKPVIAVPTSVGYGANFGGLSALLTMLNGCAAGVSVVNIDNGFGAGYIASMINRL